ncbi:hypothetical protein PTQ19_15030 [Microbacterium esteraromaticum]|uniref:hypothetical protein n=1 Tax=Microbacterium esteraromaticum TaxID=57043 RepID=UPI002368421F|nr:hypothetical protein [Microbacterium esteraromaticum]WDH78801.1 hypothetical protein PTQ19_15030 [Microbacterium esteraromaticum]
MKEAVVVGSEAGFDWQRDTRRLEVPSGVDDPWLWGLGMPYLCLSAVDGPRVMPASPESIPDGYENWDRRHRQALAYYTALQSFLTYSFGWVRHDKGLAWCYENAWPEDDPRLNLIRGTWLSDETLLGYLAWVLERMDVSPNDALTPLRPWALRPDLTPISLSSGLASALSRTPRDRVWTGGADPMHLWGGYHAGAPSGPRVFGNDCASPSSRLLGVDRQRRTATLVAEHLDGWYASLADLGSRLPDLADGSSWRVDVFVKSIGFLGTYRRSWVTGLWFSGRHRFHAIGN